MRALTLALIFHFTLNPLLYLKGRVVLKPYKLLRITWTLVFSLELILYFTVYFFYRSLPPEITHFGRVLGTSWMLFVIYFGSIILIFDFFYLLSKRQLNQPKKLCEQPQRTKNILLASTLLIVVLSLSYGRYKFKNPSVNNIYMTIDKNGNKHDSLRIVVVGDLHLGYTINHKDAQRIADLIMAQKADLILMVGDIIDSSIEPLLEEGVGDILREIKAPLGVYSCPGNHEYRMEAEEKMDFLNNVGITLLRDSVVLVDSSFYIVGREDWIVNSRQTTEQILDKQNVDRSLPIFLLNHSPYDLSEDANANVDIALYGHTHHGQAFPGNIATDIKFEVAYGYKEKGNTNVYVTSGLGLAGPQHRIGTASEIAVLSVILKKAS